MTVAQAHRVAVIGGGQSAEHEVSLASAADVATALRTCGFDVMAFTIARDGIWYAHGRGGADGDVPSALGTTPATSLSVAVDFMGSCDVIFPALHGPGGEDGTLAALASLLGVPCVGAPLTAGALAMDKWVTKLVAEARGIATAPGILLLPGDAVSQVPLPAVVKPVAAGSSFGVSLVRRPEELAPAVAAARQLDDRVLIEQFVEGREIDVAVIDYEGTLHCGPPLEIVRAGVFDAQQKYDGNADFRVPAALDAVLQHDLEAAACVLFRALGCRGLARVDFFVTAKGLVLNEVNTMPGLTVHSQVPKMFAAEDVDYGSIVTAMVHEALAHGRVSV